MVDLLGVRGVFSRCGYKSVMVWFLGYMRKLECISVDTQNVMADPLEFELSDLELRVIRNLADNGFLIPYYVDFNDTFALLYTFEGYSRLSDVLGSIDMDEWKACMMKLFECVEIIENNGFLNVCNLCIDPDYVYYDTANKKTVFLYLPVNGAFFFDDAREFTNSLRLFIRRTGEETGLLDSVIRAVLADANSDKQRLKKAVSDFKPFKNNTSVEPQAQKKNGILSGFGFKKTPAPKKKVASESAPPVIQVQGGATEILEEGAIGFALVYKGNDYPLRMEIKRKESVIGKQKETVDHVIPFSKAVSRVHCMAGFNNGEATIKDLGSSNGTFVNGRRLEREETAVIREGDIVKIANLEFLVEDIKA